MSNNYSKDDIKIKIVKSVVSLAASGLLLFIAVGFGWFTFNGALIITVFLVLVQILYLIILLIH